MAGCIAHAQNGLISTSGLKSDVTIVFLDPDFLKDAKILAIRSCVFFIAHARNGRSGLKADDTIVFLDPAFL